MSVGAVPSASVREQVTHWQQLVPILLAVLQEKSSGLFTDQAYDAVARRVEFPREWYLDTKDRSEPRWKNYIRWARNDLRKLRLLAVNAYGFWRLNLDGRTIDPSVIEVDGPNRITPARESRAWLALEHLGRDRFMVFLRSIRNSTDCLAVKLANKALDEGKSLDQIFFTGREFGFLLAVNSDTRLEGVHESCGFSFRSVEIVTIEFGCLAGRLAGDGGCWKVVFDSNDTIERVNSLGTWIS